jgi:hypothetical protein
MTVANDVDAREEAVAKWVFANAKIVMPIPSKPMAMALVKNRAIRPGGLGGGRMALTNSCKLVCGFTSLFTMTVRPSRFTNSSDIPSSFRVRS